VISVEAPLIIIGLMVAQIRIASSLHSSI